MSLAWNIWHICCSLLLQWVGRKKCFWKESYNHSWISALGRYTLHPRNRCFSLLIDRAPDACMHNALSTFCQVIATLLVKETKQKDPDIHIFIYSKQNFQLDRKGRFRLLYSSTLLFLYILWVSGDTQILCHAAFCNCGIDEMNDSISIHGVIFNLYWHKREVNGALNFLFLL